MRSSPVAARWKASLGWRGCGIGRRARCLFAGLRREHRRLHGRWATLALLGNGASSRSRRWGRRGRGGRRQERSRRSEHRRRRGSEALCPSSWTLPGSGKCKSECRCNSGLSDGLLRLSIGACGTSSQDVSWSWTCRTLLRFCSQLSLGSILTRWWQKIPWNFQN